jgi:pimeloyl-ACP methyl ester carboxylesterase
MAEVKLAAGRAPRSFGVLADPESDWAFKRTLAYINEKAAEIGECLYAARRIDATDGESWIGEWAALAARVEGLARGSLAGRHRESAREAFLRASNYYRTAEYGAPPDHPRFQELWEKSVACFHEACALFDPPVERVEIPFAGVRLPGYFWRPGGPAAPRPTYLAVGGNDTSGEEVFLGSGPAAVRRGYNYFTFEYPGQRGVLHRDPSCVKRPDYEVPFAAALDRLAALPGVDERIALAGVSFGGHVVARVASQERRIAAVIPNSPLIDFPRATRQGFLATLLEKAPPSAVDAILERALASAPVMRALLHYTRWSWGARTYGELLELPSFGAHVLGDRLGEIRCPALALVSAEEGDELVRQAREFHAGIASEQKRLHVFELATDGSNDHCQIDNLSRSNQVTFDWLDDLFAYRGDRRP